MELDPVIIGARIKQIREDFFGENRVDFADRCHLTPRHIGDIERGLSLMSIPTLHKISTYTGIPIETILYGKNEKVKLKTKDTLIDIIEHADKDELKMCLKHICLTKSYFQEKNSKNI